MQWKNWGVTSGVAVMVMAAMVGCAPIQPVTPAPGETTTEATSEATTETTTETTTQPETESAATAETASDMTYDDPFAYCAAVGTVDEADERYVGEELPLVVLEGIREALDATDVDLEVFEIGTVWRCMDNQVYACNVGANLPCLAKADESREPTQPMVDYCADNAGSDFIPAVVTGRATVYNWACEDTEPVVVEQYTEVDSQGYLEFVWYELAQPQ